MPYVPHTPEDVREMLQSMGLARLDDLFRSIPEGIRLRRPLKIPARRSEAEILAEFERLAAKNRRMDDRPCFLGAGSYRRFVPAALDYLASRGEFNTAYTPYQPEVSQGTLQAVFEYQTLICRLTGMEISNASMYEAGTALAEAALMAFAIRAPGPSSAPSPVSGTGRGPHVLVSEGVHPEYRRVLATYLAHHPLEVITLPLRGGVTPIEALRDAINENTVAVAVQSPNFLGLIEDGPAVGEALGKLPEKERPLFLAVVDPVSLGALVPPGEYGADVALGDGQSLGNYPAYGGPTFGFFATRMAHVRKVPGRIVGETRDRDGKRGYVLTFQTREQHIRRERATSNICTNQGLLSLRGAMYLTLLGEHGLRAVAEASARRARHAFGRLTAIAGIKPVSSEPFFCEFALRLPLNAEDAYRRLDRAGITGGLPLGRFFPERGNEMLFAFTEMTTADDVTKLVEALTRVCAADTTKESHGEARKSALHGV